jgi:alcohol dehydrogenase class IV
MPEKVANLARLLGEKVDGLALDEVALKAKEAIIKLMRDIEFPSGIAEFGFDEDDVSRLAKNGMKIERLLSMSPRRVKLEQLEGILRKSIRNW